MQFTYKKQLYYIGTDRPNIIILPNKEVLIYGGLLHSYPPKLIKGTIILGLIKLITLQGGISFAKVA
jgi:hypothetical protein